MRPMQRLLFSGPVEVARKPVPHRSKHHPNFRITIAAFAGPVDSRMTRPQECPVTGCYGTSKTMTGLVIGCVRVSTNDQDLTARKNALVALGLSSEKTSTDQGLARADRARPTLKEARAA